MKYRYTPVGGGWMPMLRVGVHLPNGAFFDSMLMDSGSQDTLMRLSWLTEFGAEFEEERLDLTGLGSESVFGRPATVEFAVEGTRFAARVIGVEDRLLPFGLLGHAGFFEHFRVTFETAEKTFSIKSNR